MFFDALMEFGFLQNALLAGLLASVGCGLMGTYVVVKKIGFMAGGIAHALLGGMGAAFFFNQDPITWAFVTAIFSALLIGWVSLRMKQQEDTLISALWAIGMATGIIFISQTPGYKIDLMSYLFGSILLVSDYDLLVMLIMDLVLLTAVGLFYRQFLAVSFDEEFAALRGIPVTFFYLLLLCLVAITVVLLIRVVGLILVIALLTLPAAISSHYTKTIGKMMLLAMLIGALLTSSGLALSYQPDLPAGPVIILLSGIAYVVSVLLLNLRRRWQLARRYGEHS